MRTRRILSSRWTQWVVGGALVALFASLPLLSIQIPGVLPGPTYLPGTLQLLALSLLFAALALSYQGGKLQLAQTVCKNADQLTPETTSAPAADLPPGQPVYLRVAVRAGAKCQFSYSLDGNSFRPVGIEFAAREGKWIGAKVGLFCTRPGKTNDGGTADIDWFRVE